MAVAIDGDLAYMQWEGPWGYEGFHAIDISDPSSMSEAGNCNYVSAAATELLQAIMGIVVADDYAYCAARFELLVFDIQWPDSLNLAGMARGVDLARDLVIAGDLAYVAGGAYGLHVCDFSDPVSPAPIRDTRWANAYDVAVAGDYAFVADQSAGVQVFNITDPETWPVLLGSYGAPNPWGITVDGDYAYVADHDEGLVVLQVFNRESKPDSNFALSTEIDLADLPIARCELTTTPANIDSIRWELSADGGANWQEFLPGVGKALNHPGSDLLWKANLYDVGGDSPVCDSLYIEWWLESPLIDAIGDIPDDQGGWMRVEFVRSGYDFENTTLPIDSYHIWRRVNDKGLTAQSVVEKRDLLKISPGLAALATTYSVFVLRDRIFLVSGSSKGEFPEGTWEMVQTLPGAQQEIYAAAVPTYADTNAVGDSLAFFCVSAHRTDPSLWYVSPVDSGFSIDNLTPQTVRGLCLTGDFTLIWRASDEEDLDYYTVYVCRDSANTDLANVVAQISDTSFVLPDTTAGCYIFVTASDDTGLESPPSNFIFNPISSNRVPDHFYLSQNVPNPFNPITEIAYGIPRGAGTARVTLSIYNTLGRRVKTLVDLDHGPGTYTAVWDGRDHHGHPVATGMYFYRLRWSGKTETKRMVLLK
jgi:hypothetical protein